MPIALECLPHFDKLLLDEQIRAILWLDPSGKVKLRRGQARALKLDSTPSPSPGRSSSETGEAVYIRRFGVSDYLAVIFDEDTNFDSLKKKVDHLAASLSSSK